MCLPHAADNSTHKRYRRESGVWDPYGDLMEVLETLCNLTKGESRFLIAWDGFQYQVFHRELLMKTMWERIGFCTQEPKT